MSSDITIISARWVIPIEPAATTLEHHCVVIENGKIKALLPTNVALEKYSNAHHINKSNHALLPGFINAHTHAPMNLFRGFANDLPLMQWLNEYIWPAEAKWVDKEFIRDGNELAIAEMLLRGTTCFNDMYFFPDIVANTAQQIGIKASVGMIVLDFPSVWAKDANEYFNKGVNVHDEVRSLSNIHTTIAPHAPYTVCNESLERVRTYADELKTPIHMHVHETAQEIKDSLDQHQCRPLQRLNNLGLLNPRMMAVHMTQLTDEEINLSAQHGINVVHCPESNQKLASGQCRVSDLLSAGTNVCLGTDSVASNNDLDMLGELRTAALSAKNLSADAKLLPASQALELATINGARALNLDNEIGSLKKGKSADLIAIDLNQISTQPVYDPIAQIVYSASRDQITDVWVSGKQLVKDRELITIKENKVLEKSRIWGDRIAAGSSS